MKPIVIIYASDFTHKGLQRLIGSLSYYNWDYHVIRYEWRGWSHRLKSVWKSLAVHKQTSYTHAIHVDAYDVIATGPSSMFESAWKSANYDNAAMILATELNCWPDKSKAELHPQNPSPWKYAHSQFTVDLSRLDELSVVADIPEGADDQGYLMDLFLSWKYPIRLDYGCRIVQSIAFAHPWQNWFWEKPLTNRLTGSEPLFAHGNGGTDMSWLENQ